MIPIRDINPTRRFPILTVALITVNVLVFLYENTLNAAELEQLFFTAGVIPRQVTSSFGPDVARDLLTSMFLHGGWLHLLSNMLYLWIFGNNIEDTVGPIRYIVFYLLSGFAATFAQVLVNPDAGLPTIGASGAIAGVLGAYLVTFPHARVQSVVFFFYFIRFVEIPAVVVLGFWFVLQFFNGVASLNMPSDMGGVAYFAHIGGFLAGLVLIFVFRIGVSSASSRPRRSSRPNRFRDEFPDMWE